MCLLVDGCVCLIVDGSNVTLGGKTDGAQLALIQSVRMGGWRGSTLNTPTTDKVQIRERAQSLVPDSGKGLLHCHTKTQKLYHFRERLLTY